MMNHWMGKLGISVLAAILALGCATASPVAAIGEVEESSISEESVVEETAGDMESGDAAVTTDVLQDALESLTTETSGTGVDYYGDDYYDTNGNATLIKEEKIIYDSEEMQFIAVTTKDGSVFYVLINYAADNEEDNVYFLNKVDDYDLYALIYAGDESSSEEGTTQDLYVAASEAADRANGGGNNAAEATTMAANETTIRTETQSSNSGSTNLMLIGIGVVVLAGAGFAFYKFKSKGGKKKSQGKDDDFDGFEDDFDDISTADESEDNE